MFFYSDEKLVSSHRQRRADNWGESDVFKDKAQPSVFSFLHSSIVSLLSPKSFTSAPLLSCQYTYYLSSPGLIVFYVHLVSVPQLTSFISLLCSFVPAVVPHISVYPSSPSKCYLISFSICSCTRPCRMDMHLRAPNVLAAPDHS